MNPPLIEYKSFSALACLLGLVKMGGGGGGGGDVLNYTLIN